MQICSKCQTQSPDTIHTCPECGADLTIHSTTAEAIHDLINNPRVRAIRLSVPEGACPACRAVQGTYAKSDTPKFPVEGCSGENGCAVFYEPVLNEVFP